MPREGQTISYTGEEALAVQFWQRERDSFNDAWETLSRRMGESDEEGRRLLAALDVALGDVCMELMHVLHARLVRVFPHLADVIGYLL